MVQAVQPGPAGGFIAQTRKKNLLYAPPLKVVSGAVKKQTLEACEQKYVAAHEAYRRYLDERAKEKFGEYTKAARAVKRSRAHLFDCIQGKRGLDSVRRMVAKIEAADAGGKEVDGTPQKGRSGND